MAQIIDQIVNISIQESISGVTTTDVNTVAILAAAASDSTSPAGKYSDLASVIDAYGSASGLAGLAAAFFGSDNHPVEVVCIPCSDVSGAKEAMETAEGLGLEFYHIVINDDNAVASSFTGDSGLQAWLTDRKKFMHVQMTGTKGSALISSLSSANCDRVAIYAHNVSGESMAVRLVAGRCGTDSAKGTWAHKNIPGITADSYNPTTYKAAIDAGMNIYCKVAGENRLFMGTTAAGADSFIDNVVKDDWIRFNVQSKIFTLLGEANNGAGVTYDDAGIASVAAAVSNVLGLASATDRLYIMSDYSVDFKDYAYIAKNASDKLKKRELPFITGTYKRMNSVHTVNKVTLNVTI